MTFTILNHQLILQAIDLKRFEDVSIAIDNYKKELIQAGAIKKIIGQK